MPPFENFAADAAQLEQEIARKGVALGIDWSDEGQVRKLAREALDFHSGNGRATDWPREPAAQARLELFGLAHLMLNLMRQSAEEDIHTHGGPVWKSFGRALWQEAAARKD